MANPKKSEDKIALGDTKKATATHSSAAGIKTTLAKWVRIRQLPNGGTLFEFTIPDGYARVDGTFNYDGKQRTQVTTTASQPLGIKKYDGIIEATFTSANLPEGTSTPPSSSLLV